MNIIRILSILSIVLSPLYSLNASVPYKQALEEMAEELAETLRQQNHPAVAVYPFYESGKHITEFSRVVSEDFSIALGEFKGFKIFEREYLEQMMKEHRLNAEGLIDPRTAKRFGMLIAADYYITGKINILNYSFRLSIFAINTETGERIFGRSRIIPLNADLAVLAGIKDWKERFKMHQDEQAAGREDCEKRQTGDVCFINHRHETYEVQLYDSSHRLIGKITVEPHSEACMYDLPAGKRYYYKALKSQIFIGDKIPKGQFRVVICATRRVGI